MMFLWPFVWFGVWMEMAFPKPKPFTPNLVPFPTPKRGRKKRR